MNKAGLMVLALVASFPARNWAGEISLDDKFQWSSYMICWPLNRDFRGFKDRPLQRPRVDTDVRLTDLRNAVNAGLDAFSVDLFIEDKYALGAFEHLVKLIHEHRLPLQLSPMFDGFARPGVTEEDIVAKVRGWFERFAKEPCVVTRGGRPIIFTFGAYGLKAEQWRSIFEQLRATGYEGYWVAEVSGALASHPSLGLNAAKPWLDLFPAGNIFLAYDPEHMRKTAQLYQTAYPSWPHQWVGAVNTGYWRPEIAVYHSPHGTRIFRETWRQVGELGLAWVHQATWNDFGENHQIMPSENHGTTFMELNCYLAARWKGKPEAIEAPRLYLSQKQEAVVGEEAAFELLALLRPQDVPASLILRLTDATGKPVHEFEPVKLVTAGMQAAEFGLPVAQMLVGRLLFPEGRLDDSCGKPSLTIHGPYTIVYSGGYRPERNDSWLYTPAHQQVFGVRCEWSLDGHAGGSLAQAETKGGVALQVSSAVELADVEILHDGAQIVTLSREKPEIKLTSPVRWEGRLPVNRRGILDWGAYAARAVTADGRVVTSLPVFVERPPEASVTVGLWTFDADDKAKILDSSPWLHDGRLGARTQDETWRPQYALDPWGGKCLRFDGIDDRVLLDGPIVPPNAYTVECWVKPTKLPQTPAQGQIIFATANAAVILGIAPGGALQLSRKGDDRWYVLTDSEPLLAGRWQHVAATYDGATLRLYRDGALVGEQAVTGEGQCGQVSIGYNSVTNGGFYCGDMDEVRLLAAALPPEDFSPHNPRHNRDVGAAHDE